ncbi:MAG: hypothetical protein U1E29_13700, partial [Coriobacteriia bacterium]|nr:hypothetical protein [Coriobacteriia bacterium]
MHMKRVLIASIDTHTRAMVTSALESLDVTITQCTDGELATQLTAEETDLVVVDAGRDVEPIVQIVERAVTTGLDAKVLLLLEPEALTSLRMPSTVVSDFLVRGAASAELLARARGLLWPGEEASTQELVRVDALTINLATY